MICPCLVNFSFDIKDVNVVLEGKKQALHDGVDEIEMVSVCWKQNISWVYKMMNVCGNIEGNISENKTIL